MKLAHYDPVTDTAFFKVEEGLPTRREPQGWGGVVDRNDTGGVVGIEIWFASSMIPEELLGLLPAPDVDHQTSAPPRRDRP